MAALAVTACGDDDGDEAPTGYGAELRADFVEECTDAGTAPEVCGCLYDRIEAEISFESFRELDEQLRSGDTREVPVAIEAIAVGCAADPDSTTIADG